MKRFAPFLLFLATSAFAANKPNLAGTWKENFEKSSKSTLTSYVNTIDAAGDTIKITTTTSGPRGDRTSERTYVLGKETTFKMSDGDEAVTTAKWEGKSLVIVTTLKEPEGASETKETWTVSADGKTLTKARHIHNSRGDRDETHVLEKQ